MAKKRVVNINDTYHLSPKSATSMLQKVYAFLMISMAARISDKIITISNFSKAEILKFTKIKAEKVKVIYCGVDTKLFKPLPQQDLKTFILSHPSVPKKFVLYVGNVKPHKNLKTLIQAFLHLKGVVDGYSLVIVGKKDGFLNGDPELLELIRNNVYLKDNIFFSGFIENEDLPYYYNLASLFIFPSLYEGFGLPPLEALSCGCPVVASNAASIPEICEDNVVYFNPNSVEELSKLIEIELSSSKERKPKNSFQWVSKFSWETYYKEQIVYFNSTL